MGVSEPRPGRPISIGKASSENTCTERPKGFGVAGRAKAPCPNAVHDLRCALQGACVWARAAPAGLLSGVRVWSRGSHAARLVAVLEEHIRAIAGGPQAASSSVRQRAHTGQRARRSQLLARPASARSPAVLECCAGWDPKATPASVRPRCSLGKPGERGGGGGRGVITRTAAGQLGG